MHVGLAVVADEQSFELMEPGEGAFDNPAHAAEAGAMDGLASRDLGLDPALVQRSAVRVVVVAAVADDQRRSSAWPAGETTDRRDAVDSGTSWVTSWRLPPVRAQARGIPLASTRTAEASDAFAMNAALPPLKVVSILPVAGMILATKA